MSTPPSEMIYEVLRRLPVKDLLRFRSVSKSWCALIDSPDFMKDHLKHSLETESNLSIIIRYLDLYSIDFEKLDRAERLTHPIQEDGWIELLGHCNGLVALLISESNVSLWNPSTRRYRKLPNTPIALPSDSAIRQFIVYGFGHDPVTEDYKLVRMIQFRERTSEFFKPEVNVYSLKANSWRRIEDLPYYLVHGTTHGELACNALHWLVSTNPVIGLSNLIVAFDMGLEEYRLVPHPDLDRDYLLMKLSVLGGCLGLTCEEYWEHIDVWVMKEYGVWESWTRLIYVLKSHVPPFFRFAQPLAYSKDHEKVLILVDFRKLYWYDYKMNKMKRVRIQGIPSFIGMLILCVESLVPLDDDDDRIGNKNQGAGESMEKKEEKGPKQRDDFLSEGFNLVL